MNENEAARKFLAKVAMYINAHEPGSYEDAAMRTSLSIHDKAKGETTRFRPVTDEPAEFLLRWAKGGNTRAYDELVSLLADWAIHGREFPGQEWNHGARAEAVLQEFALQVAGREFPRPKPNGRPRITSRDMRIFEAVDLAVSGFGVDQSESARRARRAKVFRQLAQILGMKVDGLRRAHNRGRDRGKN